jgi:hypothetical protein
LKGDLDGVTKAAEKTADAVARVGSKGGYKGGGSGSGNIFGKRHSGGPVLAGIPYLVGREGAEELFIPRQSGYVVPNSALVGAAATGSSSSVETHRFIIQAPDGRTLEEWWVRGKEMAVLRGRA